MPVARIGQRTSLGARVGWQSTLLAICIATFLSALAFSAHAAGSEAEATAETALSKAQDLLLSNPAESLSLADIVLSKNDSGSLEIKNTVQAKSIKSQALFRLNRHPESLVASNEALEYAKINKYDGIILAELFYTRGATKRVLGDLKSATIDVQESLKLFEDKGDLRGQSKCLQVLAAIYQNAGNYNKSKEYYDNSIEIFNSDKFMNMSLYNNRGILYNLMNKYSYARDDFSRALDIAQEGGFPDYVKASIISNLASAEIRSGDIKSAKVHIERGLLITSSGQARRERPFLNAVRAQFYSAIGDYALSAELFDDVFSGLDLSKTTPAFKFFHEIAADTYAKVGRNDVALQHYRAFKRLDDEARDLMVNTNSALMAAQFDFANQDLRIARLKADQLQKDAELARSRNRITLILLGGSVLTAGLMGFNFLSLRRSSRRIEAANTRLNDANESLERALKAKSEFLATTSHEIRTPLNGILGVTQVLLADPRISPEVRDRVTLMHGAGETMRALVNDILDAAKIESGTLTIEKGDTDLAGLLDDAVRLWTDKAEEKGLSLRVERAGAPARIIEDGPRLRQIVFNLLSNAIKFTDQGSVRLSAGVERTGESDRLVVRVADSGIGIPADQVETIFESFRQVDGGVTRRFGGTGLGLSISRDLAEAMGGTLGVESELGKGSTFTLTLPLVLAAKAADGAGEGPCPAGDVFLIIEANPLTQSVLKSVVAPLGIAPETVGALDAAVSRLSEGGVGGVLVDAAGLGAETPERLEAVARLVAAGARRIAVTWPSPEEDLVRRLLAAGATQVIAKPISAAKLTAALKEGLDAAA